MSRALLAAAALAIGSVTAISGSGTAGAEPAPRALTTAQIAAQYAPLVYFHPSEANWPTSMASFVSKSSLKWSINNAGDRTLASQGNVTLSRLSTSAGANAYSTNFAGRTWRAYYYSRPRGNDAARPGLASNEGMYLDLADTTSARAGITDTTPSTASDYTGAPLYYDVINLSDGSHAIAYWFFHAYNHKSLLAGATAQNHEGDWEHIVLHFSSTWSPRSTTYFQHEGCTQSLTWASTPRNGGGTHPNVYSALGSHASYPTSGSHKICGLAGVVYDYTSASGKRWYTWGNLANIANYYGVNFGGAWGEVGNFEFTTGPSGPRWKAALPSRWAA